MKTVILGTPLAGKTTLANKISTTAKIPIYNTDSIILKLKKQNNLNLASFENAVSKIIKKPEWVIEGRHISRTAVANADKIIWLNPSVQTVIFRKFRQSGLNKEFLMWGIDLIRNQYFGKLDMSRIEDPTYSHNKKYSLLLKSYNVIPSVMFP